jgi:hypothetical protein
VRKGCARLAPVKTGDCLSHLGDKMRIRCPRARPGALRHEIGGRLISSRRYRLQALNRVDVEREVLDRFWYSRGIVDDSTRAQLVEMSLQGVTDREERVLESTGDDYVPPGVSSTWDIRRSVEAGDVSLPEDVAFASQRIVDLHRFLGSREDIDVVFMVQREPELLRASGQKLVQRILELRIDEAAEGMDVIKLAESQPALLLDEFENADSRKEKLREAWSHGLVSGDDDQQWQNRFEELQTYKTQHGDCHVGHRDGDPKALKRWCKKQRYDMKAGDLEEAKVGLLTGLGFEWDDEHAEWLRWFNEFTKTQDEIDSNLTKPEHFYLINWMSVQRIAKKSRVLTEEREQLLTEVGFNFDMPDPLS